MAVAVLGLNPALTAITPSVLLVTRMVIGR